jgi:hypothetical protein
LRIMAGPRVCRAELADEDAGTSEEPLVPTFERG